jgi:hypothetical protein
MPQLQNQVRSLGLRRLGDLFPSLLLGVRVDARRLLPANTLLRNHGRLADLQSGPSALGVVFGHQGIRHSLDPGPGAGQRREDHPIFQSEVAPDVGA